MDWFPETVSVTDDFDKSNEFVEVMPFDGGGRAYTYRVPAKFSGKVVVGSLVKIPLGSRVNFGIVWKTDTIPAAEWAKKVRDIAELCCDVPVLTPDALKLCEWISAYYAAPFNSVLQTILPGIIRRGVRPVTEKLISLAKILSPEESDKLHRRAKKQAALYDFLAHGRSDMAPRYRSPVASAENPMRKNAQLCSRTHCAEEKTLSADAFDHVGSDRNVASPEENPMRKNAQPCSRTHYVEEKTLSADAYDHVGSDRNVASPAENPMRKNAQLCSRTHYVEEKTLSADAYDHVGSDRNVASPEENPMRKNAQLCSRTHCAEEKTLSADAFDHVGSDRNVASPVLRSALPFSATVIDALVEAGIAREEVLVKSRLAYDDDFEGGAKGTAVTALPPVLNDEQQAALTSICRSLDENKFKTHLLHGVTGSGKTEVYIGAVRRVLEVGGSAIFLVPEVALTPQTVERLRSRLSDCAGQIVVWHSNLSSGERYDAWLAMARGEARLLVGARSAIFAPLKNLRLIVVDEEHEPSFKQGETPFYHGRDVAVFRAHLCGAVCVLGSATPSLESFYNARNGKYVLNRIEKRIDDRAFPPMKIIDMRREILHASGQTTFSRSLIDALRARLERKEQSILFLNRRGYSRAMICPDCGHVVTCPHCSAPLTYHRADERLRCHLCEHIEPAASRCPSCNSPKIRWRGFGTQRAEEILKVLFPDAVAVRLDADTMSKKNEFRKILSDFRAGKIDILLGTQMIAKGLDFPRVTLVGILDADLSLHVPDFRAAERTFQLLVQVAGRAGRGDLSGEVLVQTFTPTAAPIQFAKRADFEEFLEDELERRKEFGYPPHRHVIRHLFRGTNAELVEETADRWAEFLEENAPELCEIRGPAPCPTEKIQDNYRFHIWYFCENVVRVSSRLAQLRASFPWPQDVIDILDVDPADVG